MRVLLARPRGFCAGVAMAVAALDRALALFGAPVHAYHHIVHNVHLVRRFAARGVIFVDDVADVPEGGTVVFSAHGVSPAVRRLAGARGLRVVDATCPLVHKVHSEARRFARDGYTVVLVGHAGHDETVGVVGEAPDRVVLVETEEDVARLRVPDAGRVAYLTQTTLSVDDAARVVAALRRRFRGAVGPASDDICYATQNRQEAVRGAAPQADRVLVLGSAHSSNSRRLAELGERRGLPTRLADGPADLDPAWFAGAEAVLVTAGASVPEDVVEDTLGWLRAHFDVQVEEHPGAEETLHFQLPLAVRPPRAGAAPPGGVPA